MCKSENISDAVLRETTLEALLKEKKIVVPMIQRDYAMGRIDERDKAKRIDFLSDVAAYIKGTDSQDMTLDYIYGNSDENNFYPLDGQQRLTVLWLFHWYLLFRTGKIKKENWIKNFTYDTRQSSREFCKKLCELDKNTGSGSIAKCIKNQHWFYAEWIQDPTIDSMLRTISGEKYNDKEYKPGPDGIEGVIDNDADPETIVEYLDRLKRIKFKILEIDTDLIPNTDDLYVKMNARGKRLSDFENFKADLIASLDGNIEYPALIDNEWTNTFWKYRNENNEIDDSFMLFINRFVFNKLIEKRVFQMGNKIEDDNDLLDKKREISYSNFFDSLYKSNTKTGNIVPYNGFGCYSEFLQKDSGFKELVDLMDFISTNIEDISISSIKEQEIDSITKEEEESTEETITIIPRYNKKGILITSQKERVYLYAISVFVSIASEIDKDEITKNIYKRWMRVIQNIVENAGISSKPEMIQTMATIYKMAQLMEASPEKDIYKALVELVDDSGFIDSDKVYNIAGESSMVRAQMMEEVWKIYLIEKCDWPEKEIISAECQAFFNGSIRFLLRDEEGKYVNDKDAFDMKFGNAKVFFPNNSNNVVNDPDVMERFRRQFNNLDELAEAKADIFTTVGYKTRGDSWKKILCDERHSKKVHNILMKKPHIEQDEEYDDLLNNKELMNWYVEKDADYRSQSSNYYIDKYECGDVIHLKNKQHDYMFIYKKRKTLCDALKSLIDKGYAEMISKNEYIGGYYHGKVISFRFTGDGDGSVIYRWEVKANADKKPEDVIYRVQISDTDGEIKSKNSYTWSGTENLKEVLNNNQWEME